MSALETDTVPLSPQPRLASRSENSSIKVCHSGSETCNTLQQQVSELQSSCQEASRLEMDRRRIISNQIVRRKKLSSWIFEASESCPNSLQTCAMPGNISLLANLGSDCLQNNSPHLEPSFLSDQPIRQQVPNYKPGSASESGRPFEEIPIPAIAGMFLTFINSSSLSWCIIIVVFS